jgi:hypothetical protein
VSLSAFDQWFFAARDEENKIDGVGVPIGTTLLYKFCHNDVKAFEGVCALLERAFNAGGAHAVPPNWLPTAKSINALPEPLRRYIHDMVSNADPAGTVREVTILRDQVQALSASNRMLRDAIAAIQAQGVPDVVVLQIDAAVTQAQKVLSDWNEWYGMHGGNAPIPPGGIVKAQELLAIAKSLLASAPPAPQARAPHPAFAFRECEDSQAGIGPQAKPQPLSDAQALEVFNDLEKFLDQIEDAGLSDEQLAGESLHFVLGRVAKAVGTKGCS